MCNSHKSGRAPKGFNTGIITQKRGDVKFENLKKSLYFFGLMLGLLMFWVDWRDENKSGVIKINLNHVTFVGLIVGIMNLHKQIQRII